MPAPQRSVQSPPAYDSPLFRNASGAERAGYIEDLVRELERLAFGPELEALRAHLRYAREEAARIAADQPGG